jgi:alkylated DNA repair dioxygenase AlkB
MATKRPRGLKLYPGLLSLDEVERILACPELPQPSPETPELFRLFGDFGSNKPAAPPAPWMLAWGEALHEKGLFAETPNQYRLCDWIGDLHAQFKWHIDNDRHGEEILAISLSEHRRIGFRDPGHRRSVYEIELDIGDAYLMRGAARWKWEHRVIPAGAGRGGGRSFVLSYRP